MNEITTTFDRLTVFENQPLDQNPAAVYLAGLNSDSGRRTQRQALDTIARLLGSRDAFECDWASVRFQHATAIRAKLAGVYKPATVNKMLCALRGTLKAAWRLGLMSGEDYHMAASVESVNGETIPAGRELQSGELVALMGDCENDLTPAGARDAAIVALMYSCGLRREEVVKLNIDDYDPETGKLTVRGKRSKERTAYLINGAACAMGDWLSVRGSLAGPLFLAINKGGRIASGRLSTQAVYNMLAKRAAGAGVKSFSPHDLRRTFVSDLLDAGADIATVAKMAGHASVVTTSRYDRRPEQAKIKAAGLLHVPYHGRNL